MLLTTLKLVWQQKRYDQNKIAQASNQATSMDSNLIWCFEVETHLQVYIVANLIIQKDSQLNRSTKNALTLVGQYKN